MSTPKFFLIPVLALASVSTSAQMINHTLYFDSGKSEVGIAEKSWIDSVSAVLKTASVYSVALTGYCDAVGTEGSNMELSMHCSEAVEEAFKKDQIDQAKISLGYAGEDHPVGDNKTEAGKAKNRRVTVRITYQSSLNEVVKAPEPEKIITEKIPEVKAVVSDNLATEKLEVGKRLILKNLNFEGGSPVLLEASEPVLRELLKLMQDNPSLEIEIGGHVCCGPDMELSVLRAKKVFSYLSGYGISEKRMSYKGYSYDKPIASERTEEGRTANRRVEITILKM